MEDLHLLLALNQYTGAAQASDVLEWAWHLFFLRKNEHKDPLIIRDVRGSERLPSTVEGMPRKIVDSLKLINNAIS